MRRIYGDTQYRIFIDSNTTKNEKYYIKEFTRHHLCNDFEFILSSYKEVPRAWTANQVKIKTGIDVNNIPNLMR